MSTQTVPARAAYQAPKFKLFYPHKDPTTGKCGMNPLRWTSGRWAGRIRMFADAYSAEQFARMNHWPKALVIPAKD